MGGWGGVSLWRAGGSGSCLTSAAHCTAIDIKLLAALHYKSNTATCNAHKVCAASLPLQAA